MTSRDRFENREPARPLDAEPREQLHHRAVVGHQQLVAIERERKMMIADFERDADGPIAIVRAHREHALGRGFDFEIPVGSDRR